MPASAAPPPQVVDGGAMRDHLLDQVRVAVSADQRTPGLAIVYDGSSAASHRWTGYKRDACSRAGVCLVSRELDAQASTGAATEVVRRLDADRNVDAIFLQTPLPAGVDVGKLADQVSPIKDVDGLRTRSGSEPASARAALWVLESNDVQLRGTRAAILAEPHPMLDALALLLSSRGAPVRTVSSADPTARKVCAEAGILVTAVGQPGLVDDDWLSPGAVVIDAGVLVGGGADGDVDPKAKGMALLCPARGGLGPVTVAALVWRTVELAGIRYPLRGA
jgi:methylenetetrahydrofolate dehydrogenase (NADP+) / methenyltetrahydrofolate cyclohydrolase